MFANTHDLLARHRPDACLFCGQAAARPLITLEMIAVNVFKGEVIDPDGPPAYWATLPDQKELILAMQAAEIPAALSYHAGTHLCNHILYSGLRLADTSGSGMRCGFLHLPMASAQVIRAGEERPSIPLSMARRALILAIRHILVHPSTHGERKPSGRDADAPPRGG